MLTTRIQRVHFNPKDKTHLASLRKFIETGSWGDVKFAEEGSYLSVPEYVMRTFIAHQLKCKDIVMEQSSKAKPLEVAVAKVEDPVVVPLLKVA